VKPESDVVFVAKSAEWFGESKTSSLGLPVVEYIAEVRDTTIETANKVLHEAGKKPVKA